jgi:tRNA pseudouridine55 synthase
MNSLHGAILVNKPQGISSFAVVERMQGMLRNQYQVKKSALPKLGHGGTLDPFATGVLVICIGDGVKLARYFLGGDKTYTGSFRFGETTVSGDPTEAPSETCALLPSSLPQLQAVAREMTLKPYEQTPPMHSAKKRDGRPLYELARQGIEVEREAKVCTLKKFEIENYRPPLADFLVECTSGTYIRVLAKDFAARLGTLGLCQTLHRVASGRFQIDQASSLEQLESCSQAAKSWASLPSFIPFDRMLDGIFPKATATPEEAKHLGQGKQATLEAIVKRMSNPVLEVGIDVDSALSIYSDDRLIAVARVRADQSWEIERVFYCISATNS